MATASDIISSTSSYITAAQSTASAAIATLNSAAAGWSATSWGSIAAPATGLYNLFTSETDGQISSALAALENAVTANYGSFSESDDEIALALNTLESAINGIYAGVADSDAEINAALATFNDALSAITPGVLPAAPEIEGYNGPVWNDTFWTDLKNLLATFTANITGSDDVDTLVTKLSSETGKLQVALYAADRERKQQTLRDSFGAANAGTGARGFTYPNSMTVGLKLSAQQAYIFDLSQVSRDLIKQVFEWAKNNYQFAIQNQIAAHNADADFNLRYADVMVRVYGEQVRNVLQEYRDLVAVEMSKAEQSIKNYTLRLDVAKANAAIQESGDRTLLAKLDARLKSYSQRLEIIKTNAGIDEADDRTKLAKLDSRLKGYAQRLEVVRTNAAISGELDQVNSHLFATQVQQHATNVSMAVETAARNAKNKIDAAATAVNAAANMVQSASQISIGVLNG